MPEFNLGNLASWQAVRLGELVDFDVPEHGFRAVRFEVMASDDVVVRVLSGTGHWVVGTGAGMFSCRFAMDVDFGVCVEGPEGTEVFLRAGGELPILAESELPSHTVIQPRGPRPGEDLRRLMHQVRLNSERREALLKAEIERLTAASPAAPAPGVAGRGEKGPVRGSPALPEGDSPGGEGS